MTEQFGYRIVLDYQGTEGLKKFQKDAKETTKVVKQLAAQAAQLKGLANEFRALSKSTATADTRSVADASKKKIAGEKERLAVLKRLGEAQKLNSNEELNALRKANVLSAERRRNQKENDRQTDRSRRARARELALIAKQSRAETRLASKRKREAAASLKAQQRALQASKASGNAFTRAISRTIRYFVIFRAFQESIRIVANSIRGSLDFAALLEESQKQMAGLILSAGQLRDALGNAVEITEAFPIAMGLASEVMSQLRVDAVLTAATFQELVRAMQVSTAPGLASGLDLDEIRQVTVRFSQAATAFGIEQRDLAEEIRSTLQGTISPRNTRIATALGISNDDIRAAGEQGELFEFLQERMEGVGIAANSLQSSLTVLKSNFQDVLQIAGAGGIQPVFLELKGLYEDLIDTFTEGDLSEGVRINPNVTAGIATASEGLAKLVGSLREFAGSEAAGDIAEALAASFGDLGESLADGLPEILESFASILLTVVSLSKGLAKTIASVNPTFLVFTATLVTLLPVVRVLIGTLAALASSFVSLKLAAAGAGLAAGGGLLAIAPAIAAIAVAAGLAALILGKDYSNAVDKARLKTRRAVKIAEEFKKAQLQLRASFTALSSSVGINADALEKFAEKAQKAADVIRDIGKTDVQKAFEGNQRAIQEAVDENAKKRTRLEAEYAEAVIQSGNALLDIPEKIRRVVVARDALESGRARGLEGAGLGDLDDKLNTAAVGSSFRLAGIDEAIEKLKKKRQELSDQILGIQRDVATGEGTLVGPRAALQGDDSLRAEAQLIRMNKDLKSLLTDRKNEYQEIIVRAEGYSGELEKAHKAQASLAEVQSKMVENQRTSEGLMKSTAAFTLDTLGWEQERNQEVFKGLAAQLRNEKNATAFQGTDELDFIRLVADEEAKRLPIEKRIGELERTSALLRSADLDVLNRAAEVTDLSIRQEQSKLSWISRIFSEKRKQLEFSKKEEREENEKRIAEAKAELEIRKEQGGLDGDIIRIGSAAQIDEIQARGAEQRAIALQKAFEAEVLIADKEIQRNQRMQDVLKNMDKANLSRDDLLKIEGDLHALSIQQVELDERKKVLAAQAAAAAQEERERTQAGAGFDRGLQDAADSRAEGTVFRNLATNLVNNVESGLTDAVVAAFTGGDTGAAIDQMVATIGRQLLQAVIQAYIIGPIVAGLSPTAQATGGGGIGGFFSNLFGPKADGGEIGASNIAQALPGHPSSDTALIAATPGEYMLTKSMTQALGVPFLDGLRGKHSSASEMRHALQSRLGNFSTRIATPYAGGGTISRQATSAAVAQPRAVRGGSPRRLIAAIPVTPRNVNELTNNRTMDSVLRSRKSGALRMNSEEWL